MKLLIKNGRVVDPKNEIDSILDVLIVDGKIAVIEKSIEENGCEVIDAENKIVTPGFVDMHVHFRIPGYNFKEDLKTGSRAALKGGVTSVATMPNTNPVIDDIKVLEDYYEIIKNDALINIYPIASVTKGLKGDELVDFKSLDSEVVAFSDDGMPIMNKEVLLRAIEEVPVSQAIISHCEDFTISKNYKDSPWPCEGEYTMVKRNIDAIKGTGKKIHIAHISCQQSLEYIIEAKKENVNVTCEVTPHHFSLSEEEVELLNPCSKVNPPIRSIENKNAIIEGIRGGYIDAIATDHAPHEEGSKKVAYDKASFGISGIETSFTMAYTNLVLKEKIALNEVVAMMTYKPAEILNIKKGSIGVGDDADIVIIDVEKNININSEDYISKGKNSPLKNYNAKSEVIITIVDGQVRYKDGEFVEY